jgi:hypothetical protein
MTGRLLELPGISVWGGVSLARAAKLPLGFAQSVLPVLPSGYGGLRSLARAAAPFSIVWVAAALAGIAALCAALVWQAWRWRRQAERDALATPVAIAAGLAAALIAPLAWDPLYDKLWLLPTALAFLLGGLVVAGTGGWARRGIAVGAVVLVAIETAVNATWAIPAHRHESPYLEPARVVARTAQPGDLIVLDWDPVSELYSGLWGTDGTFLTLPTEAVLHGPTALVALDSAVAVTRRRGRSAYFLGVLDETPAAWDAFLGQRLHLPYAALDRYRDSSVVYARFGAGAGNALTLRRLSPPDSEVAR